MKQQRLNPKKTKRHKINIYSNKKFKTWLGRSYDYIKSNELKPLLPYPGEGCNCGIFSNFFDSYNDETKRKLLKIKNDNIILYDQVSWDRVIGIYLV